MPTCETPDTIDRPRSREPRNVEPDAKEATTNPTARWLHATRPPPPLLPARREFGAHKPAAVMHPSNVDHLRDGAALELPERYGKPSVGAVPAPEVSAALESWESNSIADTDAATLAIVMPAVRKMVAAAGPETPLAARKQLWSLTPMAVWQHRRVGVFDVSALNHDTVETWISGVNATRSPGWRNGVRAGLKKIGVAVNPQGWPRQPKPLPHPPVITCFTPQEEAAYIDAAALPGFANPEGRQWVAGAAIGAGLNGPELAAAHVGDVQELDDGGLAARVRGQNPRLVRIRGSCTGIVRQAVSIVERRPAHESRRFILASHRCIASQLANKVSIGRGRGLSLRRARNTWLTAHLHAETPLLALREMAGPLDVATLNGLLAASAAGISAEQAAIKGLRA